ncbi:MAG TPA: hypothetical protein VK716_06050 [Terracidiphilus sp.]|jgi:hypothetical protein|nr:hypothetical protein [Terracidiphilus sp.]
MYFRLTSNSHYSRAGRALSWQRRRGLWIVETIVAGLALMATVPACAQYQGQLSKKDKDQPVLRAVGVLEWTGDEGKPKKSRLVPLTVFDGEQLQDGGVYLARPQPLAVSSEVEYQLKRDGANIGLFDVENAAQEEGMWVGYGKWLPMPKPKAAAPAPAKIDDNDADSEKPVLHRKHGASGSDTTSNAPPPDPDRPTLHKAPGSEDGGSGTASSGPAADPDRPTLHKKDSGDSAGDAKPAKGADSSDVGHVESLPEVSDPDRPRLMRGKSSFNGPSVTPSLLGLPPDMEQTVAVSDVRNAPEHPWKFAWANLDDEAKMKGQMEDVARAALGLAAPAAPSKPKTAATKKRMTLQSQTPPALFDEHFRVFELAYGSGATLVLTARTDGPPAQEKFVTLIAQPDLYGSLLILFKSVADGGHLDDTPRMRLVDAVDAFGDNRGELVFELRGATQRQFALYRVLRGTAEKVFVSGGSEIVTLASE